MNDFDITDFFINRIPLKTDYPSKQRKFIIDGKEIGLGEPTEITSSHKKEIIRLRKEKNLSTYRLAIYCKMDIWAIRYVLEEEGFFKYKKVLSQKTITTKNLKRDYGFKLKIELIPSATHGNNLRNCVSPNTWNEIRRMVYRKYNYQCAICKARGVKLHCHEVWKYNDKRHIQRLKGLIALCEKCHQVNHIGRIANFKNRLNYDLDRFINHFTKINNCDEDFFYEYYAQKILLAKVRSFHSWITDLGKYDIFI